MLPDIPGGICSRREMYYRNTAAVILRLERVSESPGRLVNVKKEIAGTLTHDSDAVGKGQSLRICISNASPGKAAAAGPVTPL